MIGNYSGILRVIVNHKNPIRMKKSFFTLLLVLGFSTVNAQQKQWAIGLRLGEPTGINVKKYFGKSHALDLSLGGWGYVYGGRNRDYRDGYRNGGVVLMGNYLWQKPIKNAKGLQWYYGLGGQLSSTRYYEGYYSNNKYYYRDDVYRNNVALGLTVPIGLEWFIPNSPISLFGDVTGYVELFPAPFWINLQGGLGGRFNF